MSEAKCYLCAKPGSFDKLFRNCKHQSACHDCLRDRYVTQAQHVESYPLKCFHPDCDLAVCNTQMKRYVRSVQELQNFHRLDKRAKSISKLQKVKGMLRDLNAQKDVEMHVAMQEANWGENWREVWGEIKEALGNAFSASEIRRCPSPKCGMLITKNGGCSHMKCICGCNFKWHTESQKEAIREIEDAFRPMEEKYDHFIKFYEGRIVSSRALQAAVDWKKNKANRAPLVRIDEQDIFAEDYSFEAEESNDSIEIKEEEDCGDLDSISFPSFSLVEALDSQTECWEQDSFGVLELASDVSDSDWSQVENSQAQFNCDYTNEWEEVSEVSSVVISSHSKQSDLSFVEAARSGAAKPNPKQEEGIHMRPNCVKPKRKRPQTQVVAAAVENEMFGAEFMYQGAKGARGGKGKFRFNHEKKHKYSRYDQRKRSVARQRNHDYTLHHHQRPKFASRLD